MPHPPPHPPDTPTATTAASTPASGTTARLVALQTSLAQLQPAGQVDANAAEDLNDRLDEVAQKLTEGDAEEAAKKVADVDDRLADLRKDDKITSAAYDVLRTNLDRLADSLPKVGKDRRDRDDED